MAPRTTLAKAAGRGGSTRKVKNPLDEDDMGMPISHPYKKKQLQICKKLKFIHSYIFLLNFKEL